MKRDKKTPYWVIAHATIQWPDRSQWLGCRIDGSIDRCTDPTALPCTSSMVGLAHPRWTLIAVIYICWYVLFHTCLMGRIKSQYIDRNPWFKSYLNILDVIHSKECKSNWVITSCLTTHLSNDSVIHVHPCAGLWDLE